MAKKNVDPAVDSADQTINTPVDADIDNAVTKAAEEYLAESDDSQAKIAAVRMVIQRDHPDDGPTEADVHPDEVQNYLDFGWQLDVDDKA
ncbi:MAG: hypothetical protein CTY18_05985 [Methylomonas sp.]|nr:MAG: hypothetical protein CTY18_05985 [Methylomonas sp.]